MFFFLLLFGEGEGGAFAKAATPSELGHITCICGKRSLFLLIGSFSFWPFTRLFFGFSF
jgi:hypothetical protein